MLTIPSTAVTDAGSSREIFVSPFHCRAVANARDTNPRAAQARYAVGTREILECWFEGKPIREEYLIVDGGKLAGAGAHSYSAGDATRGSEEAVRFKA